MNSPTDNSVIELWNIVFVEHCQDISGKLKNLSRKHVDTGMGLERLTAILSGSRSNYDTDLFHPLFENIAEWTKTKPYSGSFQKYVLHFFFNMDAFL